jgi:hypothetical protein
MPCVAVAFSDIHSGFTSFDQCQSWVPKFLPPAFNGFKEMPFLLLYKREVRISRGPIVVGLSHVCKFKEIGRSGKRRGFFKRRGCAAPRFGEFENRTISPNSLSNVPLLSPASLSSCRCVLLSLLPTFLSRLPLIYFLALNNASPSPKLIPTLWESMNMSLLTHIETLPPMSCAVDVQNKCSFVPLLF